MTAIVPLQAGGDGLGYRLACALAGEEIFAGRALDEGRPPSRWDRLCDHRAVLTELRAMPAGVRVFLGYSFLVLGVIGVSLRWVVDQAISAPVSPVGVVVMVLLAYTIFTTTLVLQRKQASRALALGLASLTLPLVAYCLVLGLVPQTVFLAALAALLFRGLLSSETRSYLSEE